jgi:GNAT superfamily N-acetyltransferase
MARPVCSTLTLTIRKAENAAELADAAALYERAGTAAFTWRPKGYFRADDFIRFADEEEVWLALASGALLGILSLFRPENFIHCLYVEPDAQRLGVGRALVDHLRAVTGQALTLKLDTPNKKAIAFYEATGWHQMIGPDDIGVDVYGIEWARYRHD